MEQKEKFIEEIVKMLNAADSVTVRKVYRLLINWL